MQENQVTDQLTVIKRWRGRLPGGLESGFALHLVEQILIRKLKLFRLQ